MFLVMVSKLIWVWAVVNIILVANCLVSASGGGGRVFQVTHKFAGQRTSLEDFIDHDRERHGRNLAGIDIPLGGDGLATGTGLYYTKIEVGSPSKDFFVQIDTGSDVTWLNCITCKLCPSSSDVGVNLTLYDPNSSIRAKNVSCNDRFCSPPTSDGSICRTGGTCGFGFKYADGTATTGYFVNDVFRLNQVSGDLETTSSTANVNFGCGVPQFATASQFSNAVDGILGFGNSSGSIISQLASSGIAKKKFAHCLNSATGGGIFAIGNVVEPKVNTTPLVPNQPHYNVNMEAVKVGNTVLPLPKQVFEAGDNKGTVIDSGSTLVYLPEKIYGPLMNMIISSSPGLNITAVRSFSCFIYERSLDDAFPTVTFQFQNSLELSVRPHDYLIEVGQDAWCIGWRNSSTLSPGLKDIILLGDLVLKSKLVLYDLEDQVMGWTDHDCSSSVGVQDEKSGLVYQVAAHDISPSSKSSTSAGNPPSPTLPDPFLTPDTPQSPPTVVPSPPGRPRFFFVSPSSPKLLDQGRIVKFFLLTVILFSLV